jgi:hypothetical protein
MKEFAIYKALKRVPFVQECDATMMKRIIKAGAQKKNTKRIRKN